MNFKHRFFLSFFSVFICAFFIFSNMISVRADAATLIVDGGSVGTGGLTDLSPTVVGPATIAVALGLYAGGIDARLTNESVEAGLKSTDYVQGQMKYYCDSVGLSFDDVCSTISDGIDVLKDGTLQYSNAVCKFISQLGSWIVGDSADNYQDITDPSYGSTIINGFEVPVVSQIKTRPSNTSYFAEFTFSSPVCVCIGRKMNNYASNSKIFFSDVPWTASVHSYHYDGYGNLHDDGIINYTAITGNGNIGGGIGTVQFGSNYGYIFQQINTILEPELTLPNIGTTISGVIIGEVNGATDKDTFYGDKESWSDFVPGLSLPEGYTGHIDAGILDRLLQNLQENTNYVLGVRDYLQALEDSYNGELDKDVDVYVVDDPLSTPVSVPVPDVLDVPEYDQVAPVDQPQEGEYTPAVDPSVPAQPDDVVAPMLLDLTDIFPFCIPFDIYALLQKFVADPVAPSIHVQFTVPIVNADVDYNFSLAPFATVALILRNVEMALLIVGLAVATRRIYLRG